MTKRKEPEMILVHKNTPPFFMVDNSMLEDERLTFNAKWVMTCVCYLHNQHDGDARMYADNDRLAELSQLMPKAIAAALEELILHGYLTTE